MRYKLELLSKNRKSKENRTNYRYRIRNKAAIFFSVQNDGSIYRIGVKLFNKRMDFIKIHVHCDWVFNKVYYTGIKMEVDHIEGNITDIKEKNRMIYDACNVCAAIDDFFKHSFEGEKIK